MLDIRPGQLADAAAVLNWVNDPDLWHLDDPASYRKRSLVEFLPLWQEMVEQHAVWLLRQDVEDVTSSCIGQVGWVREGVALPEATAEVFITLACAKHRRLGYGRWALQWLMREAQAAGLARLRAKVLAHNAAAQAFFVAAGFRFLCAEQSLLNGQPARCDVMVYERALP